MTSTTTEPSTYTVERQKLSILMGWIESCPSELAVTPAQFATVASHIFGRDIQPEDLTILAAAIKAQTDFYPTGWTDTQLLAATRYLDLRVEQATDILLDCRRCAGCSDVITDESEASECSNADVYCCRDEHRDSHIGSYCEGMDYDEPERMDMSGSTRGEDR